MPVWAWILIALAASNLLFVLLLVRADRVRQKRAGEIREELRALRRTSPPEKKRA